MPLILHLLCIRSLAAVTQSKLGCCPLQVVVAAAVVVVVVVILLTVMVGVQMWSLV
jgi:hypothetical protein